MEKPIEIVPFLGKLTAYMGHSESYSVYLNWRSINTICFSPDSRYMASAADDRTIKLWDLASKQLVHTYRGHKGTVNDCAFSSDGKTIVSVSQYPDTESKEVKLWNVHSGQPTHIHNIEKISREIDNTSYNGGFLHCALSPDNKYIITAGYGINIFEVETEKHIRNIPFIRGYYEGCSSLSVSHDGQFILASSTDGSFDIIDFETGKLVRRFNVERDEETVATQFSYDDKWIVSSTPYEVELWNAQTGESVRKFESSEGNGPCVFSPDAAYVIAATCNITRPEGTIDEDDTYNERAATILKIWNTWSGEIIRTIEGNEHITSLAVSPDSNYLVTGDPDGAIKIWHMHSGEFAHEFKSHEESTFHCIYSYDGKKIASSSVGNSVKIWDSNSGALLKTFKEKNKAYSSDVKVKHCAFSPNDAMLLTLSNKNTLRVWNTETNELLHDIKGENYILSATFSYDNKYIAFGEGNGDITILDAITGKTIKKLIGNSDDQVAACHFSPDSKRIIIDCRTKIIIWDIASEKIVTQFKQEDGATIYFKVAPNFQFAAFIFSDNETKGTRWARSLRIWSIPKGKYIHILETGTDTFANLCDVAISYDSKRIVSLSNSDTLKIWDATSGKLVRSFFCKNQCIARLRTCAFSPDSKFIITSSVNNAVKMWDAETGELVKEFYSLPNNEAATIDRINQKVIYQSANAYEHLGITAHDANGCITRFPV